MSASENYTFLGTTCDGKCHNSVENENIFSCDNVRLFSCMMANICVF